MERLYERVGIDDYEETRRLVRTVEAAEMYRR